jgi:pseudaminic acid synthase
MSYPYSDIKPIKISHRQIGPGHPVYIVAELSANHRQDFDEAVRLIHAAKASGANAVKLQTYTPDTMTIDCDHENFRHGKGSLWEGKTLYRLYQEAYMPWEWQPRLKKIAEDIGLDLFSSAYDAGSVDFLKQIDIPAIKISSFEMTDLPLIRHAAKTDLPLIISTGMATIDEIQRSVDTAKASGCKELVLLKCTSAYPTRPDEMNLKSIVHLAETFGCPCGLSDHSLEGMVPVVATAVGICMIEKHFTLSRKVQTPDKGFSLEPEEFKAMVNAIRMAETVLGSIFFGPTITEHESLSFRRSLYAVSDIQANEKITAANVRAIRPAGGLSPESLDKLIGRPVKKTVTKGTPITTDLFSE